ncbi:MAG: hypothetical protein ABEJ95_06430 [Candidatus Nanohalobium sp.]
MVDWQAVDLGLSILVKTVFLVVFVVSLYVLKRLDEMARSAERSAESIERTAEDIGRFMSLMRVLPFIGPERDRDE